MSPHIGLGKTARSGRSTLVLLVAANSTGEVGTRSIRARVIILLRNNFFFFAQTVAPTIFKRQQKAGAWRPVRHKMAPFTCSLIQKALHIFDLKQAPGILLTCSKIPEKREKRKAQREITQNNNKTLFRESRLSLDDKGYRRT
ncbi:hypothetical protein B0H16DRAFT_1450638 [Mycena metata]|uniref:Uncharacterized protein n=1 Tax=Mycena metata TaxID=1033252 RepID=A0AAD7JXA7_9AGAR|nr:hypothetical protein B0H16DRAFT_1450638 [Mycena metata]